MKQTVYNDLVMISKKHLLNSLETPKQIHLLKEPFSIENDVLTPTMKVKRDKAKLMYINEITEMYSLPNLKATE